MRFSEPILNLSQVTRVLIGLLVVVCCFAKVITLSRWISHNSLKAGLKEVIIRFFFPRREWINKIICCYHNQLILGVGIVGDTHDAKSPQHGGPVLYLASYPRLI